MKKILFLQAHPDDLEFYCPHLLHFLADKKDKYQIKIGSLTKGEFGTPMIGYDHFKGKRLGMIRTHELYKALEFHGITPKQIQFFHITDANVKFNNELVHLIKTYLEEEKPDIIFAPEPRNTYYRHPDHMICGKVVYYIYDKILTNYAPKLYYYAPLNSNFYWPFNKDELNMAYKLIFTHRSQYWMMKYIRPVYRLIMRCYGKKVKGWRYAEGYRRVFYRNEKIKNRKLNFRNRIFLYVLVKLWPKDLSTKFKREEFKHQL